MKIGINGSLIKALIDLQYGGSVDTLVADWAAKLDDGSISGIDSPGRAAVFRWIKDGTVPRKKNYFPALCGMLDVDPFALLTATEDNTERAVNELLQAYNIDRLNGSGLSLLAEFFGRQADWPPKAIARLFFRREWITVDVTHDAEQKINYYASLKIAMPDDAHMQRPQVFHIAFRQAGVFADRWLQFGFVVRHGRVIRLFHINGMTDQYIANENSETTNIETWFGPGTAQFRLASLHPFTLSSWGPAGQEQARVRFSG